MKFSVLIPVYHKENPIFFDKALGSLAKQTLLANEIVIVEDGPLTDELYSVIAEWEKQLPIKRCSLPNNVGLGVALAEGVKSCSYDIIARMDGDDICMPNRFELQIGFLKEHSDITIVGSSILEFDSDENAPDALREPPATYQELLRYATKRNPFNHMTVIFRKQAIIDVGSYQPAQGFEDYFLWVRLFLKGFKGANISEPLVLARTGKGMIERRGGLQYIKDEVQFFVTLHKLKFITKLELFQNILIRTGVRITPSFIRILFYKTVIRKRI
jgi:glycosyltransferase involved in cell wall biosynthesis